MSEHFFKSFMTGDSHSSPAREMHEAIRAENSVAITLSGSLGYSRTLRLDFSNGRCVFTDLAPDSYSLLIEGGRCLWSGELDASLLLLDESVPLQLAADTDGGEFPATAQYPLIKNECEMLVYAGLETGRVCVRVITP